MRGLPENFGWGLEGRPSLDPEFPAEWDPMRSVDREVLLLPSASRLAPSAKVSEGEVFSPSRVPAAW